MRKRTRVTFAITAALSACAIDEEGTEPELDTSAYEINGNDEPAEPWMVDRAIMLVTFSDGKWVRVCTGTLISPIHVLTALHCSPVMSDDVAFYTTNDGFDVDLRRNVVAVQTPPGTNPATDDWDASNGQFADIAVLTLGLPMRGSVPATLAWTYPGDGVAGAKVGGGRHDGDDNEEGELRWVLDTTYTDSDDENDGQFLTSHSRFDPGDSGGAFYRGGRLLGVTTGEKLVWGVMRGVHTSVPDHLDWILGAIGYQWPHGTIQSAVRSGALLETLLGRTQRECTYACDKHGQCVAFNYLPNLQQCQLLSTVTGSASSSAWRSDAK